MGAPAAKPIKGTILVLHGFAQNGPNFSIKASGIRKMLKKAGYHTVFVNGPIKLAATDMPFEVQTGEGESFDDLNMRGWTYTQPGKFDIQPSLDTVKAAYETDGPFVGLMGFSQGAGVVGTILSRYPQVVGNEKAKDELKFAMMYSGFVYKDPSVAKFYEKRIELPTLHIMGELDTVVSNERSMALVDICDHATVMKHPGGHYVPSQKPLLRNEVAWIESVVAGETPEGEIKRGDSEVKPDSASAKKELDDLAAQMANLGKA